jgi:hypothetical protein
VVAPLGLVVLFAVPWFDVESKELGLVDEFVGLAAATFVFRWCKKYAMNVIITNAERKNFLSFLTKSDSWFACFRAIEISLANRSIWINIRYKDEQKMKAMDFNMAVFRE